MRDQEIAFWRLEIQRAYQTAVAPTTRDCNNEGGPSVPGSRVLITQAQLDASRMLRFIPRLPVQNANWLHFAYATEYQQSFHDVLAMWLFVTDSEHMQLHESTKKTLLDLCSAALTHRRNELQGIQDADQFSSAALARRVGLANPSPASWSKSRWAPRWRRLLERLDNIDRHSIEQLVELRKLIRHCQEIVNKCQPNRNPISRI